jgi:hypothetical protein
MVREVHFLPSESASAFFHAFPARAVVRKLANSRKKRTRYVYVRKTQTTKKSLLLVDIECKVLSNKRLNELYMHG